MPTAVIVLDFDPILRLGDLAVRLETAALGLTILIALALAARIAARTPIDGDGGTAGAPRRNLRPDDLLFVSLGILPGAVIGGRLGYVLLHLDFYRANPAAIVDPGRGGLELAMAVGGGALTAAYVASLLDGALGRWLHAAALPLLVGLGLGKAATALGGSGQGQPTDADWAVAYAGNQAWATLGPEIPSHPAQLYEAAASAGVLLLLVLLLAAGRFAARDGRLFLVAVALWALARAAVAATWRDPEVLGPLRAGQLLALLLAFLSLAIAAAVWRTARGVSGAAPGRPDRVAAPAPPGDAPRWPDPETRPPF